MFFDLFFFFFLSSLTIRTFWHIHPLIFPSSGTNALVPLSRKMSSPPSSPSSFNISPVVVVPLPSSSSPPSLRKNEFFENHIDEMAWCVGCKKDDFRKIIEGRQQHNFSLPKLKALARYINEKKPGATISLRITKNHLFKAIQAHLDPPSPTTPSRESLASFSSSLPPPKQGSANPSLSVLSDISRADETSWRPPKPGRPRLGEAQPER